jgi:hypothetical protein
MGVSLFSSGGRNIRDWMLAPPSESSASAYIINNFSVVDETHPSQPRGGWVTKTSSPYWT